MPVRIETVLEKPGPTTFNLNIHIKFHRSSLNYLGIEMDRQMNNRTLFTYIYLFKHLVHINISKTRDSGILPLSSVINHVGTEFVLRSSLAWKHILFVGS